MDASLPVRTVESTAGGADSHWVDTTHDLGVLLQARHGLIMAEIEDEAGFLAAARTVAEELEHPLWLWSSTRGLGLDGNDGMYGTNQLTRALDTIAFLDEPGIFVFQDIHPYMDDPEVIRHLKEIAQQFEEEPHTLILTAPKHDVPIELEGLVHVWSPRPATRKDVAAMVRRTIQHLTDRDNLVQLSDADFASLVDGLMGVGLKQAEQLLLQAAVEDGELNGLDVPRLMRVKARQVLGGGMLELIEADAATLADIGGMQRLRDWLRLREPAFRGLAPGLEPPKGLLMTGIPGCGKSLAAKAVAGGWSVPLILLDPARLYSKYIGESEGRLDRALTSLKAVAPAVLWIDEIEKGFASGSGDGGTSKRMLGSFLRWMQERSPGVFVVATANDVSALPPEFLRKGRFDEIFFVDLPTAAARRDIWRLQLAKRELVAGRFDIERLVALSEGFSGAEIEMAVVGALYRAFAADRDLRQQDVETEISATIPLSVSRAGQIGVLRRWAHERAVPAD